jgi:colicin import membrane protein
MPRKLKTYQTSQGFFDLAISAPSMKAALEAWGTSANLFRSGFAWESDDRRVVTAANAKPGIVLKRSVGTSEPFQEHSHLPTSLPSGSARALGQLRRPGPRKTNGRKAKRTTSRKESNTDEKARKAALAYEKEERRRRKQQEKEAAVAAKKRARRQRAEAKAAAALEKARSEHEAMTKGIDQERETLEKRADAENARWEKIKDRLERIAREARTS